MLENAQVLGFRDGLVNTFNKHLKKSEKMLLKMLDNSQGLGFMSRVYKSLVNAFMIRVQGLRVRVWGVGVRVGVYKT